MGPYRNRLCVDTVVSLGIDKFALVYAWVIDLNMTQTTPRKTPIC